MADHVQQQILDATRAVLIAAALVATGRVYLDRTDELPEDDLPAIDILGGDEVGEESIEHLTLHFPTRLQRSYSFSVTCIARGATGAAKAARNLAGEVEAALLAGVATVRASGTAIDMVLADSSERKNSANALPMVAVRQVWQAQYRTIGGAPTVAV